MSNISDAFDAIKTLMETTFPSHQQLTNPYDVGENTTQQLMKGWGIALGPGFNSEKTISCRISLKKTILIPLTRVRHGSSLLTTNKETNEKLLFEDQFTLIKALEKDPTVSGGGSITAMKYVADQGIEVVYGDSDHYIVVNSAFEMEYFESLE